MKLYYVTYITAINAANTQFFASEELAQIAASVDKDLYPDEVNLVDYIEIEGDNIVVIEAMTAAQVLEELSMVSEDSTTFNKYADRLKELI